MPVLLSVSALAGAVPASKGATAEIALEPTVSSSYVETLDTDARATFSKSLLTGRPTLTDHDDVHMFVVNTTGGFEISSFTPASAVVDSAKAHGTVKNPYFDVSTPTQGFDEIMEDGVASYILAANVPYDNALNVDPGNTASNIVVAEGEEATFVKAIRLATVTDGDQWQTIEKYVYLHVLLEVPPLGFYPPTASGTTKTIHSRNDVNWSALRSLALPASFTQTPSTLAGLLPSSTGLFGLGGEYLRRLRLDVALGLTSNNYSGALADTYAKALMALHSSSISAADRNVLADKAIIWGLQIHGIIERGGSGLNAGAGQGGCIGPYPYYAAALLNDATLWTAAKSLDTQMVSPEWVTASTVGRVANGKDDRNAQTAFAEHVGSPMITPDEWGTNIDKQYGDIGSIISAYEALATSMLQNAPSSQNGATGILNGATANDTAAPRAATLAFMDRYRTITPWFLGPSYDPGAVWRDVYDLTQPLTGLAAWTGRPDQVHVEEANFTAGDGQVLWNLGAYDCATETVTQVDARYSLDNVQWVEVSDVSAFDSVSGLLRSTPHWCGLRQVSASGAGPWGLNYPLEIPHDSGVDRNKVTTTGTDTAAAPVNTVAPLIHNRLHPAWVYETWEPSAATLDVDDTQLSCGVGYWSGYPAPTYTYQWKRDAVNISGATSKQYSRVAADADADLTCEVTATNASGSASATTAAVTAPSIQNPPAGTLIETNFRGTYPIDYESEHTNSVTGSATLVLEPTQSFADTAALQDIGISYGALKVDKTASYPYVDIPLSRAASLSTTYRVEAQLVAAEDWLGTFDFDVRRQADNTSYLSGGGLSYAIDEAQVIDIDETFTISGIEPNLDIKVQPSHITASGGTGGGDPYMTYLKISEVP